MYGRLNIQILDQVRICLDELPAWCDFITHEHRECLVRLDRIFQADHICTTARDRLLRASLAGGVPADLSWDHPVDFIIAEGKSQAEAKWDDTNAGMTWQMAWLWRHLQSPDKRWHDLQGYAHAVAMGQPELEPLIQCAARRALKLPGTKGCEVP